ncbi:MAG: type II toxin-antitoxin system HicB family antitoxin [Planctomycetota bacterium]
MKLYHVAVHREDKWYIGRVLERSGVTTQGRTLDELVDMLRDAIDALWAERDVQLELVLAAEHAPRTRTRTVRRRVSA